MYNNQIIKMRRSQGNDEEDKKDVELGDLSQIKLENNVVSNKKTNMRKKQPRMKRKSIMETLQDIQDQVEDIFDPENSEYQEISGESVFQKFPLPEVRQMTKNRDLFWKGSCCCLILVVIFIVGFLLFFMRHTQRVVGYHVVSVEKGLLIRTMGCDVVFRHLLSENMSNDLQGNFTRNASKHNDTTASLVSPEIAAQNAILPKPSNLNGTNVTNATLQTNYTNDGTLSKARNKDMFFSEIYEIIKDYTKYFQTELMYLYENLYQDLDKCEQKDTWTDKSSTYCVSYIYNAFVLFPEPTIDRMKDENYNFLNDGSKVSFAPEHPEVAEIVGFESLNSKTECKINVWSIQPLKNVTILHSGRKIKVEKIDILWCFLPQYTYWAFWPLF